VRPLVCIQAEPLATPRFLNRAAIDARSTYTTGSRQIRKTEATVSERQNSLYLRVIPGTRGLRNCRPYRRLCRPRGYADVGIGSCARCGLPCGSGRHNPDVITVPTSGHCRDRAAWRGPRRQSARRRSRAETPCRCGHRCLQGTGPSVAPMPPQQEKTSCSATSRVAGEVPDHADLLTRIPLPRRRSSARSA